MATDRRCGSCTACCTVLGIAELSKPEKTPCPLLRVGAPGCGCYKTRPAECARYRCAWLMGYGGTGDRPDNGGLLLDLQAAKDGGDPVVMAREVRAGALGFDRNVNLLARLEAETLVIREMPDGERVMTGPADRRRKYLRIALEATPKPPTVERRPGWCLDCKTQDLCASRGACWPDGS